MPLKGSYELEAPGAGSLVGTYVFNPRTNSLRDGASGAPLAVVEHPRVAPSVLPWPSGPEAGLAKLSCISVLDSDVGTEMQRIQNAGAVFVVPSRFNGTAFADKHTVLRRVDDYRSRPSGGSRAQLALHPGIGQFLLDSAATEYHKDGLNLAQGFVKAVGAAGIDLKVENGFVEVPLAAHGEKHAAALASSLHLLEILVLKGTPACGLAPSLTKLSPCRHQVNIMSICPVRLPPGGDPTFQKRAAVGTLAAQYYGALRLCAQYGHRCKVFLVPAGTGASGNSMQMVANAMSLAVEMLKVAERGLLDIHALTWAARPSEHSTLVSALSRCGKLLLDEECPGGYGPDGMLVSGHVHGPHHADDHGEGDAGRGVEVEDVAWFRGDHSRLEMERRAALSVNSICAGIDTMWRKGQCPSRRWTNDREVCNVPGLPEDVLDFPTDDKSLFVPRRAGKSSGHLRVLVGDQVRVVCENDRGHYDEQRKGTVGLVGQVVGNHGLSKGLPTFEVDLGNGRRYFYEEEWIAQDLSRARKGDKVRVYIENTDVNYNPDRHGTQGLVGVVLMDYGPGPSAYDVELSDGRVLSYDDGWVAPVSLIPEPGDMVRILLDNPLGAYDANREGTLEQVGVVLRTNCSPLSVLVHFHEGSQLFYDESWLERVPPPRIRLKVFLADSVDDHRGLRSVDGDYMRSHDQEEVAGLPVWVQVFDDVSVHEGDAVGSTMHALHSDAKGRWAVTRIADNHTLIVSRPHGGLFPQLVEQWGIVRVGTFLPIDVHMRTLSLVQLPEWPQPRTPAQKEEKAGCAKVADSGKTGCFSTRSGVRGHEAFCMPPERHSPAPPPPIRRAWKLDILEEKTTNSRAVVHTRRWVRLLDYGPTSGPGCSGACTLFNDSYTKTHCGRVFQSSLENAYFVEALNAISLRPRLAHRLFYAWNTDFSVYAVRLFMNGTWLCVEIDDFVPARDQLGEEAHADKPFCCYSEYFPEVLWPSLMEKAYAKACTFRDQGSSQDSGGWESIGGGGRVDEALMDLTGGVASSFSTKDVTMDRLFIYLYELQRDCLFVCRVHQEHCYRNGVGLSPLAHYAVNRAAHHDGDCYVQVFCSSEDGIFSGGLDDAILIPHHLVATYPEKSQDGFFWLNIADFHFYFETIFECRLVNSPDVGLPGMPPSRLPAALPPALGLPMNSGEKAQWHAQVVEGRPFPEAESAPPLAAEASGAWPPRSMLGAALLAGEAFRGLPLLDEPWDEKPLFYEHVFANAGIVTEHRPPEFTVKLPQLPCEIVACVEQTSSRITQVGPSRVGDTAVLLKVYEELEHNVYSCNLVAKSNWMPVRGAMVAFKSVRGGTFRIIAEMLEGARCERLVFRCYSSVPSVIVTAAAGLQRHLLAEPECPPAACKWTFVGSVRPDRLPRGDLPIASELDLDNMRRIEHERQCSIM